MSISEKQDTKSVDIDKSKNEQGVIGKLTRSLKNLIRPGRPKPRLEVMQLKEVTKETTKEKLEEKKKEPSKETPKEIECLISQEYTFQDHEPITTKVPDIKVIEGKTVETTKDVTVTRTFTRVWWFQKTKKLPDTKENRMLIDKIGKSTWHLSVFDNDREYYGFKGLGIPNWALPYKTHEERDRAKEGFPVEGWTATLVSMYAEDKGPDEEVEGLTRDIEHLHTQLILIILILILLCSRLLCANSVYMAHQ